MLLAHWLCLACLLLNRLGLGRLHVLDRVEVRFEDLDRLGLVEAGDWRLLLVAASVAVNGLGERILSLPTDLIWLEELRLRLVLLLYLDVLDLFVVALLLVRYATRPLPAREESATSSVATSRVFLSEVDR